MLSMNPLPGRAGPPTTPMGDLKLITSEEEAKFVWPDVGIAEMGGFRIWKKGNKNNMGFLMGFIGIYEYNIMRYKMRFKGIFHGIFMISTSFW
jgi:hypothetical protein